MRSLWVLFLFLLLGTNISFSAGATSKGDGESGLDSRRQYLIDQTLKSGIKKETLDYVLEHVEYTPKVVKHDRKQPEFAFSFSKYLERMVNDERVANARKQYFKYIQLLEPIANKYDVSPHYLVALWGLETNFGTIKPKFKLANALYSMAMDNRRQDFFVKEFITALKIYEKYGFDVININSSWAGAFGQFQFIPSSFINNAVDYDKDGKPDIIGSVPDALASAANYLKRAGWKKGEKWGRPVILPKNFEWNKYLEDKVMPLYEWKKIGVRNFKGGELPNSNINARLLLPMGRNDLAFLVYHNFDVIYSWNHANFYVIAVGYLADRITLTDKIKFNSEGVSLPSFDDIAKLQRDLCALGYYKEKIDGSFGSKTKRSLVAFQKDLGIPPDGYPGSDVLAILAKKAKGKDGLTCEK